MNEEEILQYLPLNYYVIRLDNKEIIKTNDPELTPGKEKCYTAIFKKDSPCHEKNGKCFCGQFLDGKKNEETILEKGEGEDKEFFKPKIKPIDNNLVIASYINVTEEIRSRKKLKINSKRLERAGRLVDFGHWEFNIDEKIMISSKGARKIYGLQKKRIPLKEIQQIPFPEYRAELDEQLNNLIKNGEPYNVQFKIKRASDGEIRTVQSIAEYREDKRMVFGVISDVTEKVRSQQALEESLIDLKMAQNIAKVGNWKFDPETYSLVWSDMVYQLFERDPKKGPVPFDEYHHYFKEQTETIISTIEHASRKGESFQFSKKLYLPGGKEKWIEVICRPDERATASGHYLRGTIQDISIKKNVEDELNKTNKLLRTVIDLIPDSIYMKDSKFRKLIANKGDAEHCGAGNADALIGKTDHDLYPKETADIYLKDDKRVIEHGEKIVNREERLPDGDKTRWVLSTKIPLRNGENEIIGLVGIGRDITKLREQESQRRLFQQAIEQSPLSVMITNGQGEIEYVNPGFTNTTGYKQEEVVGKNPHILDSGIHSDVFFREMEERIFNGKNWSGEICSKKKDSTVFWERVLITPVMADNREITHFVSINEDITERKEMIQALEVAKEKAEESDRLKSLFLANMSHEIRTPLNGILGFSNVICSRTEEDEDKLNYYGTIIKNCGQRLVTVIDDIIDISMIQSNQLKTELRAFDLNELLNEVYVLYKSQKQEKLSAISFNVNLCNNAGHAKFYSDKNRLFQVLKNLLDNAFKFTEKGHIRFGCLESSDDELVLFVEDSGIGIDEQKTELIFESFRQVEEGNSRKYDGSGLGLAITSGILERLNGRVWLESKPGEGSTFFVALPRKMKPDAKDKPAKNKIIDSSKKERKYGKKQIISIEDDKASAIYLKSVVKSMGYEITNFVKASEGIEFMENNPVDLVLMDVRLPELNGYDATRQIKEKFPETPVIIQTAYAMKGDREKAFAAGCDDYLSKPVGLNNLRDKIAKFVEK